MGNIALQLERSAAGTVSPSANVIFDTILYSSGSIIYQSLTGEMTFNETGRYMITWTLSTQGSLSTNGIVFAISSSQGDFLAGNSPERIGEVTGCGIITITAAPTTVSLVSASTANVQYSSAVPAKATLVVADVSPGDLSNTSLCLSYAQLSHIISQLITLYPTSVMSVFTTNINVITGTPYELYTSPDANDAGLFILINGSGQYEAIPLVAIAAIYAGDNTVYDNSITYLPAPLPLPKGCDTNLITAIRSYLPLMTDVLFQMGVTIQASGNVYKNEYGVLVLSDTDGNTPIFISVSKIARIITEPQTLAKKILSISSSIPEIFAADDSVQK
ncbi:hypothetical protein SPFL3102_02743 [Sporomusaceae bacterium FL31]|nr:hypothetical protein SPFL3101_01073 [Sporomusaceae bacterium FL31]GCE34915.1 hypothetical protein SPFL3102_02743 [Sporomusaceae bacterium]